ncbi:MAG: hypothetical protein RQ930_04235 [Candidatus Aenigmarchaeota archaeon]|nr:hypothetical protein [Candidatus Aenigmarchaeota archaeon]
MGKKKEAQVVREQESGSFLAAEKQPIASPAPEVGIQQKKETKQEPPIPKQISEMNLEELEQEINNTVALYKEFADVVNILEKHKTFIKETIAKRLYLSRYLEENIFGLSKEVINSFIEVYEKYLNTLSLTHVKKKFNIKI